MNEVRELEVTTVKLLKTFGWVETGNPRNITGAA